MSEAMKALGVGPSVDFRGKSYQLKPWTPEMTCLFSARVEQKLWDAAERSRGQGPDDAYQRRLEAVARLIAAGELEFGGPIAAKAAASLDGQKYSLFLQLKALNPDVTEELVEGMFEQVGAELQRKAEEANRDPGFPTPPPTAPPSP